MADDKASAGAVVSELHRRISSAFDVFDHESNHTVDVREIGTIIRSLGCFPTEAELHDIIAEVEEEEASGFIRFEKFLPVMTKILMDNKFRPIPEDLLLQAFEVLDQQKNGYLEPKELVKYLTQEGEPFSQEEMDEMLSAALDPDKRRIFYRDFVSMLTLDDPQ
ncbi:dynein regulatory complex protein 8 [Clarias gariepinus]|uniref:dynein regulatory complex protein 8 n=1 Tax=Clarias gariepinus TaxID=13013 RepID=UPI00234CE265|nr:dynein regulatory complex protein 8 [Clarias gariepinus]